MYITMDILTKTPGFRYVAENIFINLDFEDLENCSCVNKSWREILNNPTFWLRKLIQSGSVLEKKDQNFIKSWKILIQLQNQIVVADNKFRENLTQQLKKICLKDELKNSDSKSSKNASAEEKHIEKNVEKNHSSQSQNEETVAVLGTKKRRFTTENQRNVRARNTVQQRRQVVTKNLKNLENKFGDDINPIHWAAINGYSDVIKVLANVISVPLNTPDSHGWTPIFMAAYFDHAEIIETLATMLPIEDIINYNLQNDFGICPIYMAAKYDHKDVVESFLNLPGINHLISQQNPIIRAAEKGLLGVVKLLAPLMKKAGISPNSPNVYGQTPIYVAAEKGHVNIVKYLAPLSEKNPNAPTNNGDTPIDVAARNYDLKRDEIIQFLLPYLSNNQ